MRFAEIQELAKNIDANLLSSDKRFGKSVYIRHDDGSTMMFDCAFVERLIVDNDLDKVYYLVFTEHHGFHVYHSEDVDFIHQYEECEIYNVKLKPSKV